MRTRRNGMFSKLSLALTVCIVLLPTTLAAGQSSWDAQTWTVAEHLAVGSDNPDRNYRVRVDGGEKFGAIYAESYQSGAESAAIRGEGKTGVYGAGSVGLYGTGVWGVYGAGSEDSGWGVYGKGWVGVEGEGSSIGIYARGGDSSESTGLIAEGNKVGVVATSMEVGVEATARGEEGIGVLGTGVRGGIYGEGATGVSGISNCGDLSVCTKGTEAGVYGKGDTGVMAEGVGIGVFAKANNYGVYAVSEAKDLGAAVVANGVVYGVDASGGVGVKGFGQGQFEPGQYSWGNVGVWGEGEVGGYFEGQFRDVELGGGEGIIASDKTHEFSSLRLVSHTSVYVELDSPYPYKSGGKFVISDDSDPQLFSVDDTGATTVHVLKILGGSDLSEVFEIHGIDGNSPPAPGMVVSIDPATSGRLVISKDAYDRTVAGIISGAVGTNPGMIMGQTDTDGAMPVALNGRVYCNVDATLSRTG